MSHHRIDIGAQVGVHTTSKEGESLICHIGSEEDIWGREGDTLCNRFKDDWCIYA